MLQMFHLWTSLSQVVVSNQKPEMAYDTVTRRPQLIDLGREVDYSRWDVWMAYYRTLSYILQKGFMYAPSYTANNPKVLHSRLGIMDDEFLKVRLLQRAELKRVETSIESKLLVETGFPRSNERNQRVERWVDAVMANWRIMCGPTWQDDELGEGGKNAIARGVLDVRLTYLRALSWANIYARRFIEPQPRLIILRRYFGICLRYTLTWQNLTLPSKPSIPT